MRFGTSSTWINYAESAHFPCCSWSVYHGEGGEGGEGGLFNFLPIKKRGGRNLVPKPGYEIKGGLIRDDGSWRFMVILLSKNEAFLRLLFVFPRQMASRRFKKCFCHLQSPAILENEKTPRARMNWNKKRNRLFYHFILFGMVFAKLLLASVSKRILFFTQFKMI